MSFLNLLAATLIAVAPAATPQPAITLTADRLNVVTGQTVSLQSTITSSVGGFAHLNVTSLDGVYVDLEDWTKDVTQPVATDEESQQEWEVQAVNSGHFALYVVIIPPNGPLVVSPPVHLTVASRQTLDTGGALPVALAIPTILGLAVLATRLRPAR
ncbi:hypothetical protein F1D05_02600 [Kribbella qitaiheensis]|uniref:Uncharacterized protein n=1 Tax=Kribbella qitaiheensis TaxID=1544730 RepID=A0A7G6WSN6_9ACTN|nr:hypothetical protein [Kribbella qitaiheensis]QNE17001.1 hypothetical protein F1D05_02600 [Kribbella qitaiheensis]